MLFLTEYGFNTYVVMLQQLYNWQIDWDFMNTSLPWANVVCAHIGHALWYCLTHEHPPSCSSLFRERDFWRQTVYAVPDGSWVAPESAPRACCVDGRFFAQYCAVRHMQLLHHGRVPIALDTQCTVTPWLLRLHVAAARRLIGPACQLLLARLNDKDLVEHVLGDLKRVLMDDIWRRAYAVEYQVF
jgi:hypothetical protein